MSKQGLKQSLRKKRVLRPDPRSLVLGPSSHVTRIGKSRVPLAHRGDAGWSQTENTNSNSATISHYGVKTKRLFLHTESLPCHVEPVVSRKSTYFGRETKMNPATGILVSIFTSDALFQAPPVGFNSIRCRSSSLL